MVIVDDHHPYYCSKYFNFYKLHPTGTPVLHIKSRANLSKMTIKIKKNIFFIAAKKKLHQNNSDEASNIID